MMVASVSRWARVSPSIAKGDARLAMGDGRAKLKRTVSVLRATNKAPPDFRSAYVMSVAKRLPPTSGTGCVWAFTATHAVAFVGARTLTRTGTTRRALSV